MVFYHGRHFHSSTVGARLVDVTCEKCGTEYCYELARVGSGSEVAPYGIGSGSARRSATDQAKRDLDRRLADEAELVPCPTCQWINESLVSGYRLGRCRGWGKKAAALAILGSSCSLIAAWFVSRGPEMERGGVVYFLVIGPMIAISIAGAILVVRQLVRRSIRPNIDFPLAPRLPHGSPRPLVRNPETGELEYAIPVTPPDGLERSWVEYQVGRDSLPTPCCECLGPAHLPSSYFHGLTRALVLTVPLCKPCARRWNRRKWFAAMAAILAIAAVGLPILSVMKIDEIFYWMAVGCLFTLGPTIAAMVAGNLASPFRVKVVDPSRGVVLLWFRNEKYKRLADPDGQVGA